MKKILLINQGHTTNYGDIAIRDTMEKFFKNNNCEVEFKPFWSEEIIFGENFKKIPSIFLKIIMRICSVLDFFNLIHIKKYLKENSFDAAIIGGGELLCGHRGFNSSLYMWTRELYKRNIPIFIVGVSGDLNMPNRLIARNKKALEKCNYIWVRDEYTYNMLTQNYRINCILKPDVVFSYNSIFEIVAEKNQERNMLLCVPIAYNKQIQKNMNVESEEEYSLYLKKLILENVKECKNIIVTNSVYIDEEFSKKFYSYIKKELPEYNITFEEYSSLQNYIKMLTKAEIVISGRMHALILGILQKCNIVVIPFKKKLEVFKSEYGTEVDINRVQENTISEFYNVYNMIKNKEDFEYENKRKTVN